MWIWARRDHICITLYSLEVWMLSSLPRSGMALLSTAVVARAALSLLATMTLPPPAQILAPPCQLLMVWIVIYLNLLWIVTIQMTPWINSWHHLSPSALLQQHNNHCFYLTRQLKLRNFMTKARWSLQELRKSMKKGHQSLRIDVRGEATTLINLETNWNQSTKGSSCTLTSIILLMRNRERRILSSKPL